MYIMLQQKKKEKKKCSGEIRFRKGAQKKKYHESVDNKIRVQSEIFFLIGKCYTLRRKKKYKHDLLPKFNLLFEIDF